MYCDRDFKMGKVKTKRSVKLKNIISKYGSNIFKTDGEVLFCNLCSTSVSFQKAFSVEQHISTKKHVKHAELMSSTSQPFIADAARVANVFFYDLCEALVSADIPISKLDNSKFTNFLEKYTKKSIPDSSTLRKSYVTQVYEKIVSIMKQKLQNAKIWCSIDESTDSMGRYIVVFVIGSLNDPSTYYLLNCSELKKVNSSEICKFFDESLKIVYGNRIVYENVLLFVTDGAPYMVKAAKALSCFYDKMVYVTCLTHACHRLSEEIRNLHPKIDDLISNVKKVFLKAPSRVEIFRSEAPDLPLPPKPIITRWGTWLEACNYYSENFRTIKRIVRLLDDKDSMSVKNAQSILGDPEIKNSLAFVSSNYGFLPRQITNKETFSTVSSRFFSNPA